MRDQIHISLLYYYISVTIICQLKGPPKKEKKNMHPDERDREGGGGVGGRQCDSVEGETKE